MGEHRIFVSEFIELLVFFGSPAYIAATLIQIFVMRRMAVQRPRTLFATVLVSTAVALPVQLLFWWAMGYLPYEFIERLGFMSFFVPAFPAAAISFALIGSLVARRNYPRAKINESHPLAF
jgi:dolichyl-phosphate-mannose--protein O-mannosyl transferase